MDWQTFITLGITALALVYLLRGVWRKATGRDGDGCAGCGQCGKPAPSQVRSAPQAKPLVTLGTPPRRPKP